MFQSKKVTIEFLINYTNQKIKNWYKNAKIDYDVNGHGKTSYSAEKKEISVAYVEDGEKKTWSMPFYPEYLTNDINWVFNCWSEAN